MRRLGRRRSSRSTSSRSSRRGRSATSQPLRVTARYSDGSARDVTVLAAYSSTEKTVATVNDHGIVTVADAAGETVVVVRYMGLIAVSRVTVAADRLLPDALYAALPVNNFIDTWSTSASSRSGYRPRRRAPTPSSSAARPSMPSALPTADEARAFLADCDPQKRTADRPLLADPRYADHWADKWADLLRPNPFRAGVKSVYVLDQWLRDSFRRNKPYDQFVREILLASGSTHRDGPVVILRDKREPTDIGAFTSQIFLGVRIECARCHHHPNEKWRPGGLLPTRCILRPTEAQGTGDLSPNIRRSGVRLVRAGRRVETPVTDEVMKPKRRMDPPKQSTPSATARSAGGVDDEPDNPFFAREAVNRVWAELTGRGIVHPVDDFRASNPPTNGPLLDALAKDFVAHGYDLKHLVGTIMRSRGLPACLDADRDQRRRHA
jgi:hypothetical protein